MDVSIITQIHGTEIKYKFFGKQIDKNIEHKNFESTGKFEKEIIDFLNR